MSKVSPNRIKVLGIPFLNGSVQQCYELLKQQGGLLTAPSGPGLAGIPKDKVYYASLLESDVVIPDSGYMVLLWNAMHRTKLKRLSGLEFINYFVERFPKETNQRIMLVNPTLDEQQANIAYLNSIGVNVSEKDCYIAPMYAKNKVADEVLAALIEKQKPSWVLINIGGGTQEILGAYLKKRLSYSPAIVCTGAAIAFKTGKQVDIPVWADKAYLGWLFRIVSSPQKYYRRYMEAIPLVRLMARYQNEEVLSFQ